MVTALRRQFAIALGVLLVLAASSLAWWAWRAFSSSPPGWIADARTGCRVWNSSPEPHETIEWSGGCENGPAQGTGTLRWFKKGQLHSQFAGELRDGKANGRGKLTWAGGSYDGEFRDDKPHGRGTLVFPNGGRVDGEFRDGMPNGQGVLLTAAGGRFEGELRGGKPNGRGVMTSPGGNRYEGEFRDGEPHGRGVYTWSDGTRFEGEWRMGRPHGFGTFWTASRIYSGDWSSGCLRDRDGSGIAVRRDPAECR